MSHVNTDGVSVVVIGAGQAGLAIAYYLARRGLVLGSDAVVVDRGPATGGAWQHRWESLRLGDAHRVHDLPGMADAGLSFDSAPQHVPAREVVADYYRQYEEHFDLKVRRPVNVESVTRLADGRLEVAGGGLTAPLVAPVVIGAVGTWGSPRTADVPGVETFRGRQLTTPEYTHAQDFAGQRVAVVGGGTSAIGFIRELERVGAQTYWFTRRPATFLDANATLSQHLGRESVRLQDEAARAGRELPSIVSTTGIPLAPHIRELRERGLLERRPMFVRVISDGLIEQDGTVLPVDAIIWAMGFRAELTPFAPLGIDAKAGVRVAHGHALDTPGVFFAGYGPQASTISAERGARRIARDASQYLRDSQWPPRD